MELKTTHEETIEKTEQAQCKKAQPHSSDTLQKNTGEQSETLFLQSYSYTKNGALKVWMKL